MLMMTVHYSDQPLPCILVNLGFGIPGTAKAIVDKVTPHVADLINAPTGDVARVLALIIGDMPAGDLLRQALVKGSGQHCRPQIHYADPGTKMVFTIHWTGDVNYLRTSKN